MYMYGFTPHHVETTAECACMALAFASASALTTDVYEKFEICLADSPDATVY